MNKNLMIVVSNHNKEVSPLNIINAIKKAGFQEVFLQWYNRPWKISQMEQLKYCQKNNLCVKYVHLGYDNINHLWLEDGDFLVSSYINDLNVCYQNKINLVMMHITGKNTLPFNKLGLSRLQKIIDYAEKLNIKVALENVEDVGYLEYVLSNIKNKNLGICFDSGHYHCYFHDQFNFNLFKNRIFAVHLHDNNGLSDEHLLPFEGTNNWPLIVKYLKENNYEGPIILEVIYHKQYLKMDIDSFYQKAYLVGKRLQKMFF